MWHIVTSWLTPLHCCLLLLKTVSVVARQWFAVVVWVKRAQLYGHQYIVEMGQPLHNRVNGHRFDITHQRTNESPVAAHFNSMTHTVEDMTIMVIDQMFDQDPTLWKLRESRWIRALGTSFLQGMNLRVDSLWACWGTLDIQEIDPYNWSNRATLPAHN